MNEQAKAVLWSWARVFLAAGLAYILNALIEQDALSVRGVAIAGLVAMLPIVINWLNPADTRYGRGYVPPVEWDDDAA